MKPIQILFQSLPNLAIPFEMLLVEAGTFDMGDEHGDLWGACRPVHKVTVRDFLIGKHPVIQALWKAVMKGENPSHFQGDDLPVEQVSWDDITQKFLPELRRLTGYDYRLPTEADWEYAARGGKYYEEGYKYAGSDRLKEVGWFDENSGEGTKSVGLKLPNPLGIYDMSGNVWEWCEDDWHETYGDAPKDGHAWAGSPVRGASRVYRGGSWGNDARYCRVAYRGRWLPDDRNSNLGFRLVLSLQADGRPSPAFL